MNFTTFHGCFSLQGGSRRDGLKQIPRQTTHNLLSSPVLQFLITRACKRDTFPKLSTFMKFTDFGNSHPFEAISEKLLAVTENQMKFLKEGSSELLSIATEQVRKRHLGSKYSFWKKTRKLSQEICFLLISMEFVTNHFKLCPFMLFLSLLAL